MIDNNFDYDIALSFAGENRHYVEKLANFLKEFGLNIFYDKYFEADLWGKDLYTHLDMVYQHKSRYCILFISKYYKDKLWTTHERESAQARAFKEKQEYILPIKLDDTLIPGIRVTTGYLDGQTLKVEQIGQIILKKLGIDNDLHKAIETLKYNLPSYDITVEGASLKFKSNVEEYEAIYPIRLFIELQRIDLLTELFIHTAVVPH